MSDRLNIDINPQLLQTASFNVELYEISGRPVFSMKDITKDEIVIWNNFAPGMYFYKITSSEGYLKTGKILFQ